MSQIYIKEPPTNGKVLLKTTFGDMDIELWSKETPLACRNFVQLCLEGYYNGTMFHRVMPEFMAQGGDPTGTGEGGESIYGSTFKDEFHSRLKFNRRGLVGMANGGRDDNSSQFFVTLNRADELTGKHTLFGKITGDTLYNMIRLNEVRTDKEGRPLNPVPKILKTKVLLNPFDDIAPRIDPRKLEKKVEKPKNRSRATKNFDLLSFGEEAEDDEEQVLNANKGLKIKSSHDVLVEDPKLSSEPALEAAVAQHSSSDKEKKKKEEKDIELKAEDVAELSAAETSDEDEGEGEEEDMEFDRNMKEQVKRNLGHVEESWEDQLDSVEEEVALKTEKLRQESKQLKMELKQAQKRREEEARQREIEEKERENAPEHIKAMRLEQRQFREKRRTALKGSDREQQTLDRLEKFKSRLVKARGVPDEVGGAGDKEGCGAGDKEVGGAGDKEGGVAGENGEGSEAIESKPTIWFSHQIAFEDIDKIVVAKDASVQNEDTFDITDPRHPLNKRRRAEGAGDMAPRKKRNRTKS